MLSSKIIQNKVFLENPLRQLIKNYDYKNNTQGETPWELINSDEDFIFFIERVYNGYTLDSSNYFPIAYLEARREVILFDQKNYIVLEYDIEPTFNPNVRKCDISNNMKFWSLDSAWDRVLFDIEICKI